MTHSEKTIIVCGDGLAGLMTTLALTRSLGDTHRIVLIAEPEPLQRVVYGSTTAPAAYDFLRMLGLNEPSLFMGTSTSFAWGTEYNNWPGATTKWVQCHHQPFPILAGVPLQHHLTRNKRALSPLLIGAVASTKGKFAHPPEDKAHPLSRAEYGYQFSALEWSHLIRTALSGVRAEIVNEKIASVEAEDGEISGLVLNSGETVSGDLYLDCTGVDRKLFSALGVPFEQSRELLIQSREQQVRGLGPPYRVVEANASGWRSQTHLQNSVLQLSVTDAQSADEGDAYPVGRVQDGWTGNCIALGASAASQEPLTSGPMVMLQRDIERLLDLIPTGSDTTVERKEFNRRFNDDVAHAAMFTDAFYQGVSESHDRFWQAAHEAAQSAKLNRKTTQFKSRGVLAKFDLEPFNDEDWIVLHYGLGHQAKRYDLQAENASKSDIDQQLNSMTIAIEQTVTRMPPHEVYVNNMKRYFEKQKYA